MKHPTHGLFFKLSLFTSTLLFLSSCITPYETARMLPKGAAQLQGSFTHAQAIGDGESETVDNGYGFGLGIGLTDRVNLKFRYELFNVEGKINFVSIGPKIALKKDVVAVGLPFWGYLYDGESNWGVSPMLVLRVSKPSPKFETNLGIRVDYPFVKEAQTEFGVNLGFGWSKNLDRWAIRPDLGLVYAPGESGLVLTFGVGAQYNMLPKQKAK